MIKYIYKKLLTEKMRNDLHVLWYKLRALFYYGNKFYCNCCNKSFSKFLPKGNIPRANAECPYCGSLERNRLLLLFLQRKNMLTGKDIQLLHFAPEYCLKRIFSALKNIDYVDADINPNLATHEVDITKVPFKDNSFDLIICSHVLGHVPDEHKGLTELFRVLKPGGVAIIMTLIDKNRAHTFEDPQLNTASERLINYGEPDLCRLHGMDFKNRIEKANFYVEIVDYSKELNKSEREKYSLGNGDRELIFLSRK